jgi:Cu/Ag efflux protein CusF
MKTFIYAVAVVALIACTKKETYNAPLPTTTTASQTTASAAEKTYAMTATIVSRDPAKNTVNLDNKEVPGEMGAMKMDYELRGAKVDSLPSDGSTVIVTVHDQNGKYFISDVKPQSPASPAPKP